MAVEPDVVLGERQFFRDRMPASRYHANRWGSRVLSWFVGVPLRDTQCGFKGFTRAAAQMGVSRSALGLGISPGSSWVERSS